MTRTHKTPAMPEPDDDLNSHVGITFVGLYAARRDATPAKPIPFAFPGVVASVGPIHGVHLAISAIDGHGRLSDRSGVRALGWFAGQPVTFDADYRMVVVRPNSRGRWSVSRKGYLRVPAEYRHRCNLSLHGRVLMVADPEQEQLVILPIPIVTAALRHLLPEAWSRER
ncbi:hypothetical protein [Nocardia wallacei]|uniref:hypothetical protein n=1 Tax=Nocardia wallacei TaxID=480035 RepID=UPI0024538427|nr:hypothetical protein [Nocardia wallacei]